MSTDNITRQVPDEQLPEITSTQQWCCEHGCGETVPVQKEFTYRETFDMQTGSLVGRTIGKVWVSNCCGAGLILWDESVPQGKYMGNFIDWKPANAADLP